jgi:hypothetical protein
MRQKNNKMCNWPQIRKLIEKFKYYQCYKTKKEKISEHVLEK